MKKIGFTVLLLGSLLSYEAMATDYNEAVARNRLCIAYLVGTYTCGAAPVAGFVCVIKRGQQIVRSRIIHTSPPGPSPMCEANQQESVIHARTSCVGYFYSNNSGATLSEGPCDLPLTVN